ncbi:peptidoglycan-binding protein [Streptomyces atroolivaceus]|uniref:Peptidoglycan-binding protein n=1 Tax=Streptomyces atroolivaceus TaxID=66869 RepID=A0ABV9V387_STRAZ|nr:peptidoglycan-binding protein [Streptomyces atroolivaceus]
MSEDTPPRPHPGRRRQKGGLDRRRRALISVLAGSVVLTGAGVAAAAFIKSPAQAAADTGPPPASVLTAAVEKKVLSETVITRGKVASSQRITVSGEGAGGKDAGRSVVTKVAVKEGQSLRMGQLLLEISGRPVFVLKGAVPAYRDLGPGSTGDDVAQLQRALTEIGHGTGSDRAGTFGTGTEQAVERFYRAHEFAPVTEQTGPPPATTEVAGGVGTAGDDDGDDVPAPAPRVTVPLSEIVYVRTGPAYAEDVSAQVGGEAKTDLVSISAGELIVDGTVGPEVKGLVKPGQTVSIASEVTGARATGTIESVAAKPTKPKDGEQAGGDTYAMKVRPSGRLPADLAGEDVRLTITAASSQNEVLAVPTSAISSGEDGQTTVTVRRGQKERRVPVDTGMIADGYVQVTPRGQAGLTAGDQVIVGVDETRAGAG